MVQQPSLSFSIIPHSRTPLVQSQDSGGVNDGDVYRESIRVRESRLTALRPRRKLGISVSITSQGWG